MVTEVKIISDTHFNDGRMLRYMDRIHNNVHDMNESLIKCWNMSVKPTDICIHLGDVALSCGDDLFRNIISRLNGTKVLVKGNWDHFDNKHYLDMGFSKVYDKPIQMGNYILSHEPISEKYLKSNKEFKNFHGHSHKYQYGGQYKNFNVDISGYRPKRVCLWDVRIDMIL